MAGHSKWHNIKHKKERMDKKRGKIFGKISREIILAIREGGPDPEKNTKLRISIKKAKAVGFPSENIERLLLKAQGKLEGEEYYELLYEGYAPYGVAVLLEIITDNKNRTASEIRKLFQKYNGTLAESGSVSWIFKRKSIFSFTTSSPNELEDTLMELLLDYIEDIKISKESDDNFSLEIVSDYTNYEEIREILDKNNINYINADITYLPENTVYIDDIDKATTLLRLAEELEDHDDVQKAHFNFDIPEDILNKSMEIINK